MSFAKNDYKKIKIHMTGILYPMMPGLAGILMNKGFTVSRSHSAETRALLYLRRMGASVKGTYHRDHIYNQDLVVYGEGIREDNPELIRAREMGIPLIQHTELLGLLMERFGHTVGIAGAHGKTSAVSILTALTLGAGLNPTVLAGDRIPPRDSTFLAGSSEIMIVEADEDQEAFLAYPPRIAVLLNVEEDHLESYPDLTAVKDAFARYLALVPKEGLIIANADDPALKEILQGVPTPVLTFGQKAGDLRATHVVFDSLGRPAFDLVERGELLFHVHLPLSGSYSVYNALAAIASARALKLPLENIRQGLLTLQGVPRRLQILGEVHGITFVDDYGHHPTEIRLTLESMKNLKHRRLIAVVQPLGYRRLEYFFNEFLLLFDKIDFLVLLPVYDRRGVAGDFSSERLGEAIRSRFQVPCFNALDPVDAANLILQNSLPGDLVLLSGSHEVTIIHELIEANWQSQKNP